MKKLIVVKFVSSVSFAPARRGGVCVRKLYRIKRQKWIARRRLHFCTWKVGCGSAMHLMAYDDSSGLIVHRIVAIVVWQYRSSSTTGYLVPLFGRVLNDLGLLSVLLENCSLSTVFCFSVVHSKFSS